VTVASYLYLQEIHFSTEYIADIEPENLVEEIHGVLQHEMAHCFQNNGKGTCPGGLIEGMAGRHYSESPRWEQPF
jgi:Peptidase of plants and bacteria